MDLSEYGVYPIYSSSISSLNSLHYLHLYHSIYDLSTQFNSSVHFKCCSIHHPSDVWGPLASKTGFPSLKLLELIHIDVWGPASIQFVGDFTKFT